MDTGRILGGTLAFLHLETWCAAKLAHLYERPKGMMIRST